MPNKEQYWRYPQKIIERNSIWNYRHPVKRKLYNQHWRNSHYEDALTNGRERLATVRQITLQTANNKGKVWDGDEIKKLAWLARKNTIKDCAITLGRTYCATNYQAYKNGIYFQKASKFQGMGRLNA